MRNILEHSSPSSSSTYPSSSSFSAAVAAAAAASTPPGSNSRRLVLEEFFFSNGFAQLERITTAIVVLVGILVTVVALIRLVNIIKRRRIQHPTDNIRPGDLVEVGERGLVVDGRALNDKAVGFAPDQLPLLGEAFVFDASTAAPSTGDRVTQEEEGSHEREAPDAGEPTTTQQAEGKAGAKSCRDGTRGTKEGRGGGERCDSKECIVCLVDYEPGELLRKLHACGHLFHQECVDAWLCTKRTCPFCRTPLSLTPPPPLQPDEASRQPT